MLNLTPHPIVIRTEDSNIVIPPSGRVARVSTTEEVVDSIIGVPVVRRMFGAVEGLPEDDTPCVVSALVLAAVPGRPNTFAPDTGPTAVRDERGQIVAVTRLVAA